jgi:hypothetical protein
MIGEGPIKIQKKKKRITEEARHPWLVVLSDNALVSPQPSF